jgi:hypothetical protein
VSAWDGNVVCLLYEFGHDVLTIKRLGFWTPVFPVGSGGPFANPNEVICGASTPMNGLCKWILLEFEVHREGSYAVAK